MPSAGTSAAGWRKPAGRPDGGSRSKRPSEPGPVRRVHVSPHHEGDVTAMESIKDMIAAERTELAEVLTGLPAARWDDPTLCMSWRVREVVAHITMPFRYSGRRFAFELARSRGKFNAMADRCARRDAAVMSADELVTALRSNASHPWKP